MQKIPKKHIYSGFIIAFILISIIIPFTSWPQSSPLSDADFFKLLDRGDPDLQNIIAAADDKDFEEASELWLEHLIHRDWTPIAPVYADSGMIEPANVIMNHSFYVVKNWFTLEGE